MELRGVLLGLLKAEPDLDSEEVAQRIGVPVIELEMICRDLAREGLFGE